MTGEHVSHDGFGEIDHGPCDRGQWEGLLQLNEKGP